ncbi:MAG TPA: Dabb family protein [Panacibacter sp.]|nr:Dabb family protein [Panacibacter sp.]
MKRILFTLLIFAAVNFFLKNEAMAQTNNSASSLLRHIVMITFKQDAPADSIKAVDDIYTGLAKNPLVKDFEMGINISPRDSGVIKHIYVTTFAAKEDMDNYKKTPLYKTLFKISLTVSDDVTVADYWIKK